MALVAAAMLVTIWLTDAPRAWRLLVVVPLLPGSLGVFQAAGGT
jgi:hypothetical protein